MSAAASGSDCCIAGGGPAGMVLGFLLARAGIEVIVLEKHADFFRDFRGDTIHPSTLELMYELGVLEDFLRVPHQQLSNIGAVIDDFTVPIADFSHLPTHCKFVGLMPQWDFLNFISEQARAYPEFHLHMESEVTDLIIEKDRISGVRVKTPLIDLGAPIDVLWMHVSRQPGDPEQTLGRFRAGKLLVTLNRDDYWQCAYVISKGAFPSIQQKGLPAFREDLETVAPFLRGRAVELKSWDDIKLLSVAVDRLRHWSRPGLLCIGDSAHAMSPIGGVGINLAIQDAVAAANILAPIFARQATVARQNSLTTIDAHLHEVQKRREFPTRVTQGFQVLAHKRLIGPALATKDRIKRLPFLLGLLQRFPILRRIPARMVGLGVRPERVHTPDTHTPSGNRS